MRKFRRAAIVILTLALVAPAIIVWTATGCRMLTRIPSRELAAMQRQEGSLTGLFGEPGSPAIENSFALGLLPSGPGAELLSVGLVVIPAIFLGLLAWRTPPGNV
jgi:hypothetical protein